MNVMSFMKKYYINNMLKFKLTKIIDSFDLDDLIKETYNKPYCYQQQDGCKSRGTESISVPTIDPEDYENTILECVINGDEMGISFETWLNTTVEEVNAKHPERYPNQNDLWWERNFYPSIDMIVNDLYEKGLIEEGNYTIDIDW